MYAQILKSSFTFKNSITKELIRIYYTKESTFKVPNNSNCDQWRYETQLEHF